MMIMKREMKLGRYQHFKGGEYLVVDVARCSESEEVFVIYKALYEGAEGLWIRPVKMFLENVERDGKVFERFAYLGE